MLYKKYSSFRESIRDIETLCIEYDIVDYTINNDRSIDVNGDVNLSYNPTLAYKPLDRIPLKFRNVTGYFSCDNNQLTSLEGCPISVGDCFYCENNKLTSLVGSPRSVGGTFYCDNNKIDSLNGSPNSVDGFSCSNNKLISLIGLPMSFKDLYCHGNNLRDVRGVKDGWRGRLFIGESSPVYQIFKLFPSVRYDEVVEYLNDFDVIRDGKVVVLQALEQVFIEMSLEIPEINKISGYEII